MANHRAFEKRQRESDRRARADAKRDRKLQARSESSDDAADGGPSSEASQPAIITELAALHEDYDAGRVDFDTFEERKAALLERLSVE